MAVAALFSVREDRLHADRLAAVLEQRGLALDRSASALEQPAEYAAAIALFSPAAVRSSLLLWAAKQALEAHRLIPVFVSLCALPRAFAKTPIHDLTEWSGEDDHMAIAAIERHLVRLVRARTDGAALAQLGRGRQNEAEPMTPPEPAPSLPAYAPPIGRSMPAVRRPAAPVPAPEPQGAYPAAATRAYAPRLPSSTPPSPPRAPAAAPAPAAQARMPAPIAQPRAPTMRAPVVAATPIVSRRPQHSAALAPAMETFADYEADGGGYSEAEQSYEPPSVSSSAAARRRRRILRERMQSGLPIR